MHDNKGVDNFLIKLDTDEFLAYTEPFDLEPKNYFDRFLQKGCLANRKKTWVFRKLLSEKVMALRHAQKTLVSHNINERLDMLPITGQRYKASLTTWSLPTQKARPRPCCNLTRFTPIQFTDLKSFFHSSNFVSVDLGCHAGVSTQNSSVIHTGLTTVHYHNTSVEDSVKRAKQALLSHGYFDDEDNFQQQKDKLMQLRVSGEVSSFHKIDLYLNYIDSLESGVPFSPSALNTYHPYFSSTGVPREISIIKDTLEHIDALGLYDVA
jgi:hypothetical protein